MSEVKSIAHPNFALIKYWGKADIESNTPAMSSISITIDTLSSTTEISKNTQSRDNIWILNDRKQDNLEQVLPTLDYLNKISKNNHGCIIKSNNNFPTSAGLASSASGIASLVIAYNQLFDLNLEFDTLVKASILGSGSAPRSLLGGFVSLNSGAQLSCEKILQPDDWPLTVIICITDDNEKSISSREGMEISRRTSPLYKAWLDSNKTDIQKAKSAISEKNINSLGKIAEENCFRMHQVMRTSEPSINYINEKTTLCIDEIKKIRSSGTDLFFTIDAGPQVKIICNSEDKDLIRKKLSGKPYIIDLLEANIGSGARLVDED